MRKLNKRFAVNI